MSGYQSLLALHIVAGTAGLLLGPAVAWADARASRRSSPLWTAYLGAVGAVCLTAVGLVLWHRTDLWWLIPVSTLTVALAALGRSALDRPGAWDHAYVHGLGGSYIALITATVVVSFAIDGPLHGPAQLIAWLGPTVLGAPLLELWRRHAAKRRVFR
ncbi:hypothetical protein H0264_32540 [Nocardia huaxiensis]|uniref:DUF2306 domain-containing protein n=1 Tax=Nocardia huaxiensis TaxID=2755382 RepID=A0A7D6V9U9_9NOCA|nr:hypothetical protein [Nocardia huaxiensis]QLY29891.1 hypothetical protein H0264_32540 [Nocardia huaxiensis]